MLDKKIFAQLQEYVERHLNISALKSFAPAPASIERSRSSKKAQLYEREQFYERELPVELEDFVKNNRKPTFNQVLFSYIDNKGVSDADIYKRAGIDRKHFSKIRSNTNYRPGKNTVIALALALELDRSGTEELLGSSGYSLSGSDTFDLVIQFCLEKKIYDILSVNEALDYFSLKPLAGAAE